jgi:hypothetical protein
VGGIIKIRGYVLFTEQSHREIATLFRRGVMRDFWFRISLILLFSGLFIIRIIFKRRAGVLGGGLFPKQEGQLENGIRAVLGVPLFGIFFIPRAA